MSCVSLAPPSYLLQDLCCRARTDLWLRHKSTVSFGFELGQFSPLRVAHEDCYSCKTSSMCPFVRHAETKRSPCVLRVTKRSSRVRRVTKRSPCVRRVQEAAGISQAVRRRIATCPPTSWLYLEPLRTGSNLFQSVKRRPRVSDVVWMQILSASCGQPATVFTTQTLTAESHVNRKERKAK